MQPLKRGAGIYILTALYVTAGINHFINPEFYTSIIPLWLPFKLFLSDVAGICEIIFGILLLPIQTRRFAAWAIILLLIAIFPANIQMTIHYCKTNNPYFWLTVLRLPLQFVLIWWAWKYTRKFYNYQ